VKEPKSALGEFSRVLRTGGFLILSDIYDRAQTSDFSSGPAASGNYASSLRTRPCIEALLEDAGLDLLSWEDHTRYLKELAAQLILNADSLAELHSTCGLFTVGCAGSPDSQRTRPGYYLLVARKI
jgi:hypothetical protein